MMQGCVCVCVQQPLAKILTIFIHLSLPGQGGQQVVTQIIRGQAVSTAISGANTVATVTGQGAASPTTAGQTPPGTPRTQGQGQVKLTLAQLSQLTQVSERDKLQDSPCLSNELCLFIMDIFTIVHHGN